MNEQIREQVSALMDGELARDEMRFLLRRMAQGDAVAVSWSRYHVVRHALQRQPIMPLDAGFAESVMAQLAREPALRGGRAGQWLRWGAGGAVAASVAVAALLVTRPAVDGPAVRSAPSPAVARTAAPSAAVPAQVVAARAAEVRPPLLLRAPVETAPVSFNGNAPQPMVLDPASQPYVIGQYQAGGNAAPSGFVPYVLLGMPELAEPAPPVQR